MKSGKTIETAHRALEVLKKLMYKKMSVDEILYSLNAEDEYSLIYAKETIYKYFNTFKNIGMEIEKDKTSYILKKSLMKNAFSIDDKYVIDLIDGYINSTCQDKAKEKFEKIKEILEKSNFKINSNVIPFDYDNIFNAAKQYKNHEEKIKKLETACKLKQQLKIKYENEKNIIEYKVFSNRLIFEKGVLQFQAYCITTNDMMFFMIENIKDVEFLPPKGTGNYYTRTAVFNILNEFSKNYRLKKGEYIKENKEGYLQIVSKYQDTETLLKRLFRYGNNCEILSPASLREAMINKIEETYKNYKK